MATMMLSKPFDLSKHLTHILGFGPVTSRSFSNLVSKRNKKHGIRAYTATIQRILKAALAGMVKG